MRSESDVIMREWAGGMMKSRRLVAVPPAALPLPCRRLAAALPLPCRLAALPPSTKARGVGIVVRSLVVAVHGRVGVGRQVVRVAT
jgi:hypothetical protein